MRFLCVFFLVSCVSDWSFAADEPLSLKNVKPEDENVQLEVTGDSLSMSIAAGANGYPGASVSPAGKEFWDLSQFSRIEAVIRNTGLTATAVSLRVDNPGDWKQSPWSTETLRLQPGQSGTLAVFFGYSHGFNPSFDLDRARIQKLLFFAEGAANEQRFDIESVTAAGVPGEKPEQWLAQLNTVPENGVILGKTAPLESMKQLSGSAGVTFTGSAAEPQLGIQFSGEDQIARFSLLSGSWDLREANQVSVTVENTGTTAISPGIRIDSPAGSTDIARPNQPIAPGESAVIEVPFASATPWIANSKSEGEFISNEVSSITFLSGDNPAPQKLTVTEIVAKTETSTFEWLGSRPPAEGEWVKTFQENFNGAEVDELLWNVHTANHWDKKVGFSRDNVMIKDGVARLRFEHRTAHHNDDPGAEQKDYTTGFLDTFGKWKQRYGYFEARMKLPEAPGLWPAFWMMPDHGPAEAPRWKREQTTRGGMEFDIMEHLSGWGPHRYNVAFHWDGYGENHKSTGSSAIYSQPDKDGFITAGLLWLPGKAVYFCNGIEVGRWESERVSSVPSILMFTHVSGGWDNTVLEDSKLPADFVLDYVRCWQRSDLVEKEE